MGLIHWWPLNGNTKDYGLNPGNSGSGGTVNNNGKIGKCYEVKNSSYLTLPYSIDETDTFSISMWLKIPTSMSTNEAWETFFYYRVPSGNIVANWANYKNLKIYDDSKHQYRWLVPGTNFNYDTWFHLTLVHSADNTQTTKFYINGNLLGQNTSDTALQISSGNFVFGSGISVGSYFVNDVRIYDHALTPKEVKEISKGLVLHYDFEDGEIEETTNLLAGKSLGFGSRWETVTTYPEGYTAQARVLKRLTADPYFGSASTFLSNTNDPSYWAGKYLTLSCWYYRVTSSDPKISVGLFGNNGSTTYSSCSNVISTTDLNVVGKWAKAIIVLQVKPDMSAYTSITYIYGCSGGNASDTLYMADPQIEVKDHATPFVNGTRSAGIVYDSSGYNYNGIPTGAPAIVTNSGIGMHSCYFDGGSTAIQTPDLSSLIHDGIYTLVGWFMHTDAWSSDGYETLYGGPSGFEIEAKHSSTNSPAFSPHNWGGSSSADYRYAYTLNEWHQWAMVRTSSGSSFYFDGVFRFNGSSAGSIPSGDYFIGAWKTYGQQNYKGYIGDFKIYATALSATDVLKEYQSMANVDKGYNLTSRMFVEDPNWVPKDPNGNNLLNDDDENRQYAQLNRKGVFTARELNEMASNTFKTYDNGLLKAGSFKEHGGI